MDTSISKQKNNRSTGLDSFMVDMIKAFGELEETVDVRRTK